MEVHRRHKKTAVYLKIKRMNKRSVNIICTLVSLDEAAKSSFNVACTCMDGTQVSHSLFSLHWGITDV